MREDIIYRLVDLPASVKATVATSPDGCYNVYINARLNSRQQQLAARHEKAHITGDHLFRHSDVAQDEAEAENRQNTPQRPAIRPGLGPDYLALRTAAGYSAWQVAKLVGISTGRYVRIEQGLAAPTKEETAALHRLFKDK